MLLKIVGIDVYSIDTYTNTHSYVAFGILIFKDLSFHHICVVFVCSLPYQC